MSNSQILINYRARPAALEMDSAVVASTNPLSVTLGAEQLLASPVDAYQPAVNDYVLVLTERAPNPRAAPLVIVVGVV